MRRWPLALLLIAAPARAAKPAPCKDGAVIALIDRSTSMEGAPLAMAKSAASSLADGLDPHLCYGVVAFDATPSTIAGLTTDRTVAKARIAALTTASGTDLHSALVLAGDALVPLQTGQRTIVVLSDGQAPSSGIHDLAEYFEREGVVVSTIGLGDGVDVHLLHRLAEETHGRAVVAQDWAHLRAIFGGELARVVAR